MLSSTRILLFLALAAYLISPLAAAPAPEAVAGTSLAVAEANNLAELDINGLLLTRADKNSKTSKTCLPLRNGAAGVRACVTVKWSKNKEKIDTTLTLSDTKGDANSVEAWVRIYYNGKGSSQKKLKNEDGKYLLFNHTS